VSRTCELLLLPEADVILLVSATAVMVLTKRFEEASAYASDNIASLEPHIQYPIVRAKRLSTKFGMSVVFTLRFSDTNVVQVFLPQRYCDDVTDTDIQSINSGAVNLNLVYKGVCDTSNAYLLAVDPSTRGLVGDVSMGQTVCLGPSRTW